MSELFSHEQLECVCSLSDYGVMVWFSQILSLLHSHVTAASGEDDLTCSDCGKWWRSHRLGWRWTESLADTDESRTHVLLLNEQGDSLGPFEALLCVSVDPSAVGSRCSGSLAGLLSGRLFKAENMWLECDGSHGFSSAPVRIGCHGVCLRGGWW